MKPKSLERYSKQFYETLILIHIAWNYQNQEVTAQKETITTEKSKQYVPTKHQNYNTV